MATIVPVSPARHGAKRWRRLSSYAFAAERAVVPLAGAELGRAAIAFPIAFLRQAEGFVPAALLGVVNNRNLFVGKDGRWLGGYLPAGLRGYPFALGRARDGSLGLCVDESSGLVSDPPEGEHFFEADATPSAAVRRVLDFLTRLEQDRAVTSAACASLQANKLIEPWPLALKSKQGEHKFEGLFRVNEAALNALDDNAFLAVRKAAALPVAYAQLLSMPQVRVLEALAAYTRRAPPNAGPDLSLNG